MIRFVIVFSILAAPLAAQTALQDRPGRWIGNPRLSEPSATPAPVLEAPASGPLISAGPASGPLLGATSDPEPVIVLTAPETSILLTPPVEVSTAARPAVPDTRPTPRPARAVADVAVEEEVEVAALPVDLAPDAAVEVASVASLPEMPTVAVTVEPTPAPVAEDPPLEIAALSERRPAPRPEAEATAAMAEALAAELQASAHAITTAAPRTVPQTHDIAPEEALAPVSLMDVPEVPAPVSAVPVRALPEATAPIVPSPVLSAPVVTARDLSAPAAVPVLAAASLVAAHPSATTPSSAVYLSTSPTNARPVVQTVAFVMPPLDQAPILPRLHPSGPWALEAIARLDSPQVAQLSAALLPVASPQPDAVARLGRSAMPSHDPFPLSALPPSALAQGPDAMARTIQPPFPFAEGHAAVVFGAAPVVPVRSPVMAPAALPERDAQVTDPDAPVALPAPDAGAVARMMDDAMICWRLADLPAEAQWAQLSVDVALDETNMPSAPSIRLTGFAHVVSGAAEQAYRAAHAALMGCAEATAQEAATAPTTLIFDHSGVRIR
ncbi:hypothetical protein [Gymnodinialimonas sp. 57CJ19]|uniref:hypothetical protein n=1 Tax=Gymnodinialimonas sp. 57CJ19 TaxID=3138498 RepID=UPI00313436ED